jgi:hypothetical protein
MRQWHIDPHLLCTKHLLGEHVEHHMFVGSLRKGISLKGYIENNLVETATLYSRHAELVREMKKRGYTHSSPLPKIKLYHAGKVNRKENLKELQKRCNECRKRIFKKKKG